MLTASEIEFFHEQGYLIKRQVLDTSLIKECVDHFWESAPDCLDRDNPKTWHVPLPLEIAKKTGKKDTVQNTTIKKLPAGREIVQNSVKIRSYARSLLTDTQHIRGYRTKAIIGVLPGHPGRAMHIDGPRHAGPFIGVVGYLDDVGQSGGGFTFHPKSHHITLPLLPTLKTDNGYSEYYDQSKNGVHQCSEPKIEFTGKAGDIVLWHHALLHQHVENNSEKIRLAIFADFLYKENAN